MIGPVPGDPDPPRSGPDAGEARAPSGGRAPTLAGPAGAEGVTAVSSIAYGFMASQALYAALELGLFGALAAGPATEETLARQLGAPARPFRALLAACTALGLLERDGARFRNAPAAARYLVPDARGYMGEYYLRQIAGTLYGQVPLARGLLRGEPVAGTYGSFLEDPARVEAFIRGQHAGSTGPAALLAKARDLSRHTRLLDLGGGSGAFAIEAVRRHPRLSAVVVDHAAVVRVAEQIVAEAGLADRIRCVAGDALADAPWPAGADVILLSYVVSSYGPETLRALAARTHGYLPPGGLLLLHDFALHGDRSGPRNAALWFFANLAISATTHPHTVPELTGALAAAGYVDVVARPHIPDITVLVTGRRAAGP